MLEADFLEDEGVCAALIEAYMRFAESCDAAIEIAEGKDYHRSVKLAVGEMLSSIIGLSVNDIIRHHPDMARLMQSADRTNQC